MHHGMEEVELRGKKIDVVVVLLEEMDTLHPKGKRRKSLVCPTIIIKNPFIFTSSE